MLLRHRQAARGRGARAQPASRGSQDDGRPPDCASCSWDCWPSCCWLSEGSAMDWSSLHAQPASGGVVVDGRTRRGILHGRHDRVPLPRRPRRLRRRGSGLDAQGRSDTSPMGGMLIVHPRLLLYRWRWSAGPSSASGLAGGLPQVFSAAGNLGGMPPRAARCPGSWGWGTWPSWADRR